MATKMTREEAIKIVQSATVWTDKERDALSMLIPEFAESEDERIRKELVAFFKAMQDSPWHEEYWHDLEIVRILAYLEKQKDEEGYEEIPVESTLEYKLGFKAGKDSEKQKEQKQEKFPPYVTGFKGDPDPAGVWRPSKEQMNALYYACCIAFKEERCFHPSLSRLYHDLRKL